jgi:hypothetical protein
VSGTIDNHTPPEHDQVEISLFGPGIGECAVIHLGWGEWMIVDSCIDRDTRRPAALSYLNDLGVNIATDVKVVVSSHWHDDHCEGMSTILRAAEHAQFVCSAALTNDEFFAMVAGAKSAMMTSSGISEFHEIFEILEDRHLTPTRPNSIAPFLAKSGVCVFRRPDGEARRAEVHALSPSDGALKLSWHQVAQSVPQLGQVKRRAVALTPNQVAVVLWVLVGDVQILLGADLEETSSPTLGWRAILNSAIKPEGTACVFKVPHHGSSDAYNADVWNSMLSRDPCAVLTPFSTGGRFLPTDADVTRLRSHTSLLYCTSRPGGTRPVRRSGAVDGLADRIARSRRAIRGRMGHIRVRVAVSGSNFPVDIHCCKGAYKVE